MEPGALCPSRNRGRSHGHLRAQRVQDPKDPKDAGDRTTRARVCAVTAEVGAPRPRTPPPTYSGVRVDGDIFKHFFFETTLQRMSLCRRLAGEGEEGSACPFHVASEGLMGTQGSVPHREMSQAGAGG